MRARALLVLALAAAALPSAGHGQRATPPASSFSATIDNVWFPLKPGTQYIYVGVRDGQPSRDVVTVTRHVRSIRGVPCRAIDDRLYVNGHVRERTTDWYSQDADGNVWYFGEKTAELDSAGHVTTTEGSWTAGVDGAQAGLFMPAHPRVGQSGRQEFLKGHAEDHFRVIGVFGAVVGGTGSNAVLTEEWSPLEPGVLDHKLYVRGVGDVLEHTERGGNEHVELVKIVR